MNLAKLCTALVLASTFVFTAPAAAETKTSATSVIDQIKVVDVGDANYSKFRGALWLEFDKATANYRWGGEHCNGQGLTDLNISLLFAAFRSKYSVTVDYKICKHKKREYRCITGFSVTR